MRTGAQVGLRFRLMEVLLARRHAARTSRRACRGPAVLPDHLPDGQAILGCTPGIEIRETRIIVQLLAQTVSTDRGREIPAYTLSVPEDISPEMRPLVAAPPALGTHSKSIAEWKELVTKVAAPAKTLLRRHPACLDRARPFLDPALHHKVSSKIFGCRWFNPGFSTGWLLAVPSARRALSAVAVARSSHRCPSAPSY